MKKEILSTWFPNVISVTLLNMGNLYTVRAHLEAQAAAGSELQGGLWGILNGR